MREPEITSEDIEDLATKMGDCINPGEDAALVLAAATVFVSSLLMAVSAKDHEMASFWAARICFHATSALNDDEVMQ